MEVSLRQIPSQYPLKNSQTNLWTHSKDEIQRSKYFKISSAISELVLIENTQTRPYTETLLKALYNKPNKPVSVFEDDIVVYIDALLSLRLILFERG